MRILLFLFTFIPAGCLLGHAQITHVPFEINPPDILNKQHQVFDPDRSDLVHVANASLQLSSSFEYFTLNAIVVNDIEGYMFLQVTVLDSFSNIISEARLDIDNDAYFPDVIIRDNMTGSPAHWIVSVVYNRHTCPNNEIILQDFEVDAFVVGGLLPVNAVNYQLLGDGIYPRIDGFAEPTELIEGEFYAMKDFAVSYNNLAASGNSIILHLDEYSNVISSITHPSFTGTAPDIACITNVQSGNLRYVYMIDYGQEGLNTPSLHLGLFDLTGGTMVSFDGTNYISYNPIYRIDGHTVIDDFVHMNRYVMSGNSHCYDQFVSDFMHNPLLASAAFYQILPVDLSLPAGMYDYPSNGGHGVAAGVGYYNPWNTGSRLNRWEFTSLHSFRKFDYLSSAQSYELLMTNYLNSTSYNTSWVYDIFRVNNTDYSYGAGYNMKNICSTCSIHTYPHPASGDIDCGTFSYSAHYNASIATQPNYGDYTVACWIDETTNSVWYKQTNRYDNQGVSVISEEHENDSRSDMDCTLYPNPAKGNVTVETVQAIHEINIYNLLGRLVHTIKGHGKTHIDIDISHHTGGDKILMIEVRAGENKYYRKLVIE